MLKLFRRAHLYLGVFFAPLLLFFILTGWYQTVQVDRRKGKADADTLVAQLTTVHVDQHFPTESASGYNTQPFRYLVVGMSVALIATLVLGLVLAFRSGRPAWTVWVALAAGVFLPMLLLWLGQRR